jgi:8-oxo-dGTP diphosphatase
MSRPEVRTVVGAAIIRDGRVLACRRTSPPKAAGLWEFPGGKVEAGETREEALVREIAEELQLDIELTGWLEGASPIGTTHELVVATAVAAAGRPQPTEHDAITWLGGDELDDVDWLEPDLPFLWQLADLLRAEA